MGKVRTFFIKTILVKGVLLSALAVVAVFVATSIWFAAAAPFFIGLLSSLSALCHGLFTQCLGYIDLGRIVFYWAGGGLLLSGFVFALIRAAATLLRSAGAIKRLPLSNRGESLVLIQDRTISTAFTHGIIRPRIYISRGLMDTLDGAQLRAVFHHELAHKKNRDPLRFFLLSILKDVFFFIPVAAYLYGLMGERQEKKADDVAVSAMREPYSIAGALLKLAEAGTLAPAKTASILGRQPGVVEDRIRRLLGEEKPAAAGKGLRGGAILCSLIIPVFMLISLAMPLKNAMTPRVSTCTTSHCAAHQQSPEQNCHTHCDKADRLEKRTSLKSISQIK